MSEKKKVSFKDPSTNSSAENTTENTTQQGQEADAEATTSVPKKEFKMEMDRHFLNFIYSQNINIIVSCYKSETVLTLGFTREEDTAKLSLWPNSFIRPMGVCVDNEHGNIWIGDSKIMWKYVDAGKRKADAPGRTDFDKSFIPRRMNVISDIDCHDIAVDADGTPYFVSALFSCICTLSDTKSFNVWWKPPWITKIAEEDRCHLNGLCCVDGKPRYITSSSRSNIRGGWREHRGKDGVVYDIVKDRVVCSGLSMPHSPRWHNGRLWVLESGTGHFGYVEGVNNDSADDNTDSANTPECKFIQCVFIPGFLRGMSFIDDKYVAIGSSQDRHESAFQGIELGETLTDMGTTAKCGVFIVDLETFDIVNSIMFDGTITEIYDVGIVQGAKRAMLESVNSDAMFKKFSYDIL